MNKPDYPSLSVRLLQATLENTPAHEHNLKVICISFCRAAAPNSGSISATYKWVFFPAWCVLFGTGILPLVRWDMTEKWMQWGNWATAGTGDVCVGFSREGKEPRGWCVTLSSPVGMAQVTYLPPVLLQGSKVWTVSYCTCVLLYLDHGTRDPVWIRGAV